VVMSLLSRASWRHTFRYPWLMGLLILGVALGVAVVVAVDLANGSAGRAFTLSVESTAGKATHTIVGGPTGFDETLYTRLQYEMPIPRSAPVVEGYVESGGEVLHLIGIDPFAPPDFREGLGGIDRRTGERLLLDPGAVLLAEPTARRLGVTKGDPLAVEVPGAVRQMTVIGLVTSAEGSTAALEGLLIADIATAQEVLGKLGRLDRIDLILTPSDPSPEEIERWLPEGVRLITTDEHRSATAGMTRSFEINLQAMSFLALVVGMFLIYNTMTFSVLRRRTLIGTLRMVGVTRQEIFTQVLIESITFGLIGTALGLGLGYLMAHGLIHLVTSTINDLYFVLSVKKLILTPFPFVKGLALGLGAATAAAIPPALEAAWSPPQTTQRRSMVETRARHLVRWLFLGGAMLMLAAFGLLLLPTKGLEIGLTALFGLILGFSLMTPVPIILMARGAGLAFGRFSGVVGELSAASISTALSRTGIAIAALSVAVSITIGMGVMIGSFRDTVDVWITHTLESDIYVSSPHPVASRADGTLPPEVLPRLEQRLSGIEAMTLRRMVKVQSPDGPTELLAIRQSENIFRNDRLKKGNPNTLWSEYERGEIVLISESLAYRRGLGIGDGLRLLTDHGERTFTIGGIFYDYATDQGMVMMYLDVYRKNWDDPHLSSIGLTLQKGQSQAAMMAAVRRELADIPNLLIRPTAEIRETTLDVFDRTFTITSVLRLIAILVAFVGVLSAMMALELERTREFAILRATGITPAQLWRMIGTQTGLMGLIAALLALPLGLLISTVLIEVINTRSFGWSIEMLIPWHVIGEAIALALGAALLAGVYPAWRMARTSPAAALREE